MIINTLWPEQNGCHFAGDIFKCIFLNENFLYFDCNSARSLFPSVQLTIVIIASGNGLVPSGNKPSSEPMLNNIYGVSRPQWVNDSSTLVQLMAECQLGNSPLPLTQITQFSATSISSFPVWIWDLTHWGSWSYFWFILHELNFIFCVYVLGFCLFLGCGNYIISCWNLSFIFFLLVHL